MGDPSHRTSPRVWDQRAQHDAHRGRLAGSVAPDETEHLARTDRHVQVVDGYEGSIGLPDAPELQARRRHGVQYAADRRPGSLPVETKRLTEFGSGLGAHARIRTGDLFLTK